MITAYDQAWLDEYEAKVAEWRGTGGARAAAASAAAHNGDKNNPKRINGGRAVEGAAATKHGHKFAAVATDGPDAGLLSLRLLGPGFQSLTDQLAHSLGPRADASLEAELIDGLQLGLGHEELNTLALGLSRRFFRHHSRQHQLRSLLISALDRRRQYAHIPPVAQVPLYELEKHI